MAKNSSFIIVQIVLIVAYPCIKFAPFFAKSTYAAFFSTLFWEVQDGSTKKDGGGRHSTPQSEPMLIGFNPRPSLAQQWEKEVERVKNESQTTSKVKGSKSKSRLCHNISFLFQFLITAAAKIDGMNHKVVSKTVRDVKHQSSSILTFIPMLPLRIL